MMDFELNKNSSQPLYKQLVNYFTDPHLVKNIIDENGRLPTERELSEKFNISRITVRQALKILEDQDLIKREQGKGTFLSEEKITQPIVGSRSFSQVVKESGNIPGAKLLSAAIRLADERDRRLLNLSDDAYIVAIERIRYINEKPSAYEISHFRQDYSFLLTKSFDNDSMYDFIHKEKGIHFTDAKRTIEIVYADKEIASFLNINEGAPLLLIKGVTKDQFGNPSHLSYEYLVADKFKFEI